MSAKSQMRYRAQIPMHHQQQVTNTDLSNSNNDPGMAGFRNLLGDVNRPATVAVTSSSYNDVSGNRSQLTVNCIDSVRDFGKHEFFVKDVQKNRIFQVMC